MAERTTCWNVTFERPFQLGGELLPAGTYEMMAEEVAIDGLSFEAWQRVSLSMVVAARGRTELIPVTQADLDQALARDLVQGSRTSEGTSTLEGRT